MTPETLRLFAKALIALSIITIAILIASESESDAQEHIPSPVIGYLLGDKHGTGSNAGWDIVPTVDMGIRAPVAGRLEIVCVQPQGQSAIHLHTRYGLFKIGHVDTADALRRYKPGYLYEVQQGQLIGIISALGSKANPYNVVGPGPCRTYSEGIHIHYVLPPGVPLNVTPITPSPTPTTPSPTPTTPSPTPTTPSPSTVDSDPEPGIDWVAWFEKYT